MRKLIAFVLLFLPMSTFAEDLLIGKTELGSKFQLSKAEWPVAFRCTKYDGPQAGQFAFSIRKTKNEPFFKTENAWLIFPDHTGYGGHLFRSGLNMRFDWTDRATEQKYTLNIDGIAGFFYDWKFADDDGVLTVERSLTCK